MRDCYKSSIHLRCGTSVSDFVIQRYCSSLTLVRGIGVIVRKTTLLGRDNSSGSHRLLHLKARPHPHSRVISVADMSVSPFCGGLTPKDLSSWVRYYSAESKILEKPGDTGRVYGPVPPLAMLDRLGALSAALNRR